MDDINKFIDYYEVLQVNPNCDSKILESAYRHLAKRYHPDHAESADGERFNDVMDAYNALKTPDRRAEYDILYSSHKVDNLFVSDRKSEIDLGEDVALTDAEIQKKMLFYLYKRRRENAHDHGIAGFYVQEIFKCSDDHFDFHIWYLKSKGFISITEQGMLAITVVGVDHVLSMHQAKASEKLMIAQSTSPEG